MEQRYRSFRESVPYHNLEIKIFTWLLSITVYKWNSINWYILLYIIYFFNEFPFSYLDTFLSSLRLLCKGKNGLILKCQCKLSAWYNKPQSSLVPWLMHNCSVLFADNTLRNSQRVKLSHDSKRENKVILAPAKKPRNSPYSISRPLSSNEVSA